MKNIFGISLICFTLLFSCFVNANDKTKETLSVEAKNMTTETSTAKEESSELEEAELNEELDIPDMYDFIEVDTPPQLDLAELQKNVVYPEEARRQGIEGQVRVRAFIDINGKVQKSVIDYSDSQMLNQAALDAFKKTSFVPGKKDGKPIGFWLCIPITFKLQKSD